MRREKCVQNAHELSNNYDYDYCDEIQFFTAAKSLNTCVHAVDAAQKPFHFHATESSLRRLSRTVCCEEIWVSPKIRVLPSGALSQTPDLENLAAASRSRCQQNSSSSSTVELVDDTHMTTESHFIFTVVMHLWSRFS